MNTQQLFIGVDLGLTHLAYTALRISIVEKEDEPTEIIYQPIEWRTFESQSSHAESPYDRARRIVLLVDRLMCALQALPRPTAIGFESLTIGPTMKGHALNLIAVQQEFLSQLILRPHRVDCTHKTPLGVVPSTMGSFLGLPKGIERQERKNRYRAHVIMKLGLSVEADEHQCDAAVVAHLLACYYNEALCAGFSKQQVALMKRLRNR